MLSSSGMQITDYTHTNLTPPTMPKAKDRSALTKRDLERRYGLAPNGLGGGAYDALAGGARAQGLRDPAWDTAETGDAVGRQHIVITGSLVRRQGSRLFVRR